MSSSVADDVHTARTRWREICGLVGWVGFGVAVLAAVVLVWQMFSAALALGLAGVAMSPGEADVLRFAVATLACATGAIGVLAILVRRWVLLVLALLLFAAAIVFLNGEITTR